MVARLRIPVRGDGDSDVSPAFPIRSVSAVSLLPRPMLAVGNGDLWLMSTPFRKSGFFYQHWERRAQKGDFAMEYMGIASLTGTW
jgi:hypothetical protein